MTLTDSVNNTWVGFIPYQQGGDEVFYYIHAGANNGKQQVRPIVAPEGYWNFDVLNVTSISASLESQLRLYPNPTSGFVQVALSNELIGSSLRISDVLGRVVVRMNHVMDDNVSIDLSDIQPGIYIVDLVGDNGRKSQRLLIE
jgi:hypothetical protein